MGFRLVYLLWPVPPAIEELSGLFTLRKDFVLSGSLLQILPSQLRHILRLPPLCLDVVSKRRVDVFFGKHPVGCEHAGDVRCREEDIPVIESEGDEQVIRRIEPTGNE